MTNSYKVTVVIPAYNVAAHIERAIKSVLAQSQPADEIIIVDDGSTDKTAGKIKKFGSKVNYIYQENAGASVARNTGIQAAQYEWIAFLDSDDEWESEYLQLQMTLLKQNPHLVWTGANFYRCLCNEDRRGTEIEAAKAERLLGLYDYFEDYFDAYINRVTGWTGTMIIKKSVIEEAGMFQPGQLMANDIDLWFRIAYRHGRFGFIPKPLATYHMNVDQSISATHKNLSLRRELLERHLKLAKEHGREKGFEPLVKHMVQSWIRGMLFEDRADDINELIGQFGGYLDKRFKLFIRLLMVSPKSTASVCHLISKIVRTLHLRRSIVRRPVKL
jgi:glycosyltransferase involved in cell wall biosynthesis